MAPGDTLWPGTEQRMVMAAVAVPVSALVEHDGGPAVRVARRGRPDRATPVVTGLVADGWVEITAGLVAGEEVRLPG